MNYILTNLTYVNSPQANGDGTFAQQVGLTIGIEGDKFGFIQQTTISVQFFQNDSITDVQNRITEAAASYVLNTYNS